MNECVVADCLSASVGKRGMCEKHYQRTKRYGDPSFVLRQRGGPALCSVTNCGRKRHAREFCAVHHGLRRRELQKASGAPNCSIPDCAGKQFTRCLCRPHYRALQVHGDPLYVSGRRKPGQGSVATGYVLLKANGMQILEHVMLATRVLGRPLREGEEVHHVNENKLDNRNENLVICPTRAYHALLHQRMRALAACGRAGWRKCNYCGQYDDPSSLRVLKRGLAYHSPSCKNASRRTDTEPL